MGDANLQKLLRTVISTVCKEIRTARSSLLPKLFYAILGVVAIAYIARMVGNRAAVTYLAFGAAMIMVWAGAIATGGWAMSAEMGAGTLDFTLISAAPLPLVLFSKILATALFELPSGIMGMITVFAVSETAPQVGNALMLAVSFIFAILGAVVIGYFFCVLIVLIGGRAGFFMGIVPFGIVLSGYILPMERMPAVIQAISMFIPSSWAMNSLWFSVGHDANLRKIAFNLFMCLVISAVWLTISYGLCRWGERRIIVSGNLGKQW